MVKERSVKVRMGAESSFGEDTLSGDVEFIEKKLSVKALVSSSKEDGSAYLVRGVDGVWSCSCKSYEFKRDCKHIGFVMERLGGLE